jgi:hypothetical protein
VRLITRVVWKDGFPDLDGEWDNEEEEQHIDSCGRIFDIDPLSEKFLHKEHWNSARMSYGLVMNIDYEA